MAKHYHSFQDRGVYVGFRGRAVELVRARVPRDVEKSEFEALIPNWAGSDVGRAGSDMVMPFRDLAKFTNLVGRDELLHRCTMEEYGKRKGYMDPILMRETRLGVDVQAGDEYDRKIARTELKIAQLDVQNSFLEILAMFGRKYAELTGTDELHRVTRKVLLSLNQENPDHVVRLVRIIVGRVVAEAGISREDLQQRLDVLSEFAAPICSLVTQDESREVGFLSRQMQLLEQLHGEVLHHGTLTGVPPEITDSTEVVAANLQGFIEYSLIQAERVRMAILEERSYLDTKMHQALLDRIKEDRIRISFALDGWAAHATRWMAVDPDDYGARNAVIIYMMRQMPEPPKELEEAVESGLDTRNLMFMRGRMVKELHSWVDDRLDQDIYSRVARSRRALTSAGEEERVNESQAHVNRLIKKVVSGEP